MPIVRLLADKELSPKARAVFKDIRETRGTDYVNNFWRALAHDPVTLERTWKSAKQVMAPGALDALTKELVYIAVSTAHACEYCIYSHTAAARAKGMTPEQHAELLAVVAMASETNSMATALQIPPDEAFLTPP